MNSAGSLMSLLGEAVRFGGKPFAAAGRSIVQHPVAATMLPAFGAGLGASTASNFVNSALAHSGKGETKADATNAHGDTLNIYFAGNPASDSLPAQELGWMDRAGRNLVQRLQSWQVT